MRSDIVSYEIIAVPLCIAATVKILRFGSEARYLWLSKKREDRFIPFVYEEQYYDSEGGLAYYSFRDDDLEYGNDISQQQAYAMLQAGSYSRSSKLDR